MVTTTEPIERSLCNFVTAARVVQECQVRLDAACVTQDADGIRLAYEMREAAISLLAEVSPYGSTTWGASDSE